MPLIDALKAVASQLILVHHFVSYGPLAAAARGLAPATAGWLYDYGRMAVQVFLVIAGFLAARALAPDGRGLTVSPLPLIVRRYLRLVIPYLAAIALAIVCASLARPWLNDPMLPAPATVAQVAAHALLLEGVLGVDSLSAGLWYVAIDFQLFALFAVLLWLGRSTRAASMLVLALGTASLFWFNRNPELDNWAIYFFGSYALGAAAWWACSQRSPMAWIGLMACVAGAALVVDFRLRIALALAVALLLATSRHRGFLVSWPRSALLGYLGRISFSVFLVHFPLYLLANALYAHFAPAAADIALFSLFAAWTASIAAGALFHRWIEAPAASWKPA
jgi:peptidoglycan/LPS O-acetylase OafA/YrhL